MCQLNPHLTDDERELLNAVVKFDREHDNPVGAQTLLNRYLPGWTLQRLRETARELRARGMMRTIKLEESDAFYLAPNGLGTLLLKGHTIGAGGYVAVVSTDEKIVAQLAESIAKLHEDQRELVEACRRIAQELAKERSSDWPQRVQALVALLQGIQTLEPLVRNVLIPMLQTLAM